MAEATRQWCQATMPTKLALKPLLLSIIIVGGGVISSTVRASDSDQDDSSGSLLDRLARIRGLQSERLKGFQENVRDRLASVRGAGDQVYRVNLELPIATGAQQTQPTASQSDGSNSDANQLHNEPNLLINSQRVAPTDANKLIKFDDGPLDESAASATNRFATARLYDPWRRPALLDGAGETLDTIKPANYLGRAELVALDNLVGFYPAARASRVARALPATTLPPALEIDQRQQQRPADMVSFFDDEVAGPRPPLLALPPIHLDDSSSPRVAHEPPTGSSALLADASQRELDRRLQQQQQRLFVDNLTEVAETKAVPYDGSTLVDDQAALGWPTSYGERNKLVAAAKPVRGAAGEQSRSLLDMLHVDRIGGASQGKHRRLPAGEASPALAMPQPESGSRRAASREPSLDQSVASSEEYAEDSHDHQKCIEQGHYDEGDAKSAYSKAKPKKKMVYTEEPEEPQYEVPQKVTIKKEEKHHHYHHHHHQHEVKEKQAPKEKVKYQSQPVHLEIHIKGKGKSKSKSKGKGKGKAKEKSKGKEGDEIYVKFNQGGGKAYESYGGGGHEGDYGGYKGAADDDGSYADGGGGGGGGESGGGSSVEDKKSLIEDADGGGAEQGKQAEAIGGAQINSSPEKEKEKEKVEVKAEKGKEKDKEKDKQSSSSSDSETALEMAHVINTDQVPSAYFEVHDEQQGAAHDGESEGELKKVEEEAGGDNGEQKEEGGSGGEQAGAGDSEHKQEADQAVGQEEGAAGQEAAGKKDEGEQVVEHKKEEKVVEKVEKKVKKKKKQEAKEKTVHKVEEKAVEQAKVEEKKPEQPVVEEKKVEEKPVEKKKKKHKGEPHIELHQHKHYEHHEHINLHEKPEEHEADGGGAGEGGAGEPLPEKHEGEHEHHEHHEEPINEEIHPEIESGGGHGGEVGVFHDVSHMMDPHLAADPHHHHHEEPEHHEPMKEEHWPMHQQQQYHQPQHHHQKPIVIEDHSLMEKHHMGHPQIHYNEEIIGHPHGFGLTPSAAYNLMGAHSTTSATRQAKSSENNSTGAAEGERRAPVVTGDEANSSWQTTRSNVTKLAS